MPSPWPHIYPAFLCLVLGVSVLFPACSLVERNDPPLADTTFARVLVDLHLTAARADRPAREVPPVVHDSLFAHHGIEREAFRTTLRHYVRRPEAFSSLYSAVIDTLSALQSRSWNRLSSSSAPPDSVRPQVGPDPLQQEKKQRTRDP